VRGRRYWYFQTANRDGRHQRYVGPETPELLERIAQHQSEKAYGQQREALVSTLVRSGRLPRPLPQTGNVIAALAQAGMFRLRGVLVGTIAYQTYAAILGTRLPAAAIQTADIDVAKFADISAAVDDHTDDVLTVLRAVDQSFRPVPHLRSPRAVSYEAAAGLRVDFLTPDRGRDRDAPVRLPAFGTNAQPLPFLDFLIANPEPAVLLHGAGIYVTVPAPERYAVHKLIIAGRRRSGDPKQAKDLWQAQTLLKALVETRPAAVRAAWHEAAGRGRTWRKLMGEGLGRFQHPAMRDRVLATVEATRGIVPGLKVDFQIPHILYDADTDNLVFFGKSGSETLRFAVPRSVLSERAGVHLGLDDARQYLRHDRALFEAAARHKHLAGPVVEAAAITLDTPDLESVTKPTRTG
jgi:hypothetical protein